MEEVGVSIEDGLATIVIDRPSARNAIGMGTVADLHDALDAVAAGGARVLLLRGAGDRAFVSGGDLKELAAIRDEAGAIAMAERTRRLLDRLAGFPVPVIAALNGHALGGGAEVAVACDLRLAAADVTIGFTQVRLAIMPAWGGAERLAELVGRSRALLLIGTGRTLTPAEAEQIGLVDVVVAREEFDAEAVALARRFADLPPGAAESVKAVIAAAKPSTHPALEADAVRAFARLWVGDEHWAAAERLSAVRRPATDSGGGG